MSKRIFMECMSAYMDFTNEELVNRCMELYNGEQTPIVEAEQDSVILSLTSRLYKMIVDKVDDIDFGQIPETKGDVTKLKEYQQIKECIQVLHDIIKEYKQDTTPIDNIDKGLKNIEIHTPVFTRGCIMNIHVIELTYYEMVLAVVNSLSYMIAATIEYIKLPNDDGFRIAVDKQGIARTRDSMVYHALCQFNAACEKDQINKAFLPLIRANTKGAIGVDDVAIIAGVAAIAGLLLNILPILREITFFFFSVRTRISQYFDLQADLLEMNANSIEMNDAKTVGDRAQVVKRQRRIAEFFRIVSNKIAIEQVERERNADKELKRIETKMKYEDMQNKGDSRNQKTIPDNTQQTTPKTNDSIF